MGAAPAYWTQLPWRRAHPAPRAPVGSAGGGEEGLLPGAQPRLWRVRWGQGPLLTRAGRLRLRRPDHRLGGPSLRRGACSRGARVTTAGRAGPSPLPNVCPQGRSAVPASAAAAAAAAAALRGRRSDVSRLPSERARASGAGGAGGARGGRQGRGCACVLVCAERSAGREGGRASAGESARAPAAPSLSGPPALRGARHLPPPAPLASRPLGAAARMRSPRGRPRRTFSPSCSHCERSAARKTADSRSTPASPTPPTPGHPGKGVECACAPLFLGLGAWLLKGSQNVEWEGALGSGGWDSTK
ncbi:POLG alternative reading frame-like [Orcinus orca]|uniref:POLG alternative reading frame-like n=1 Tax=Orcinus orca TaxID=9733 RepID=UPI0021123985|nr:POLG alternative reading frame-like [Orcinus orca]